MMAKRFGRNQRRKLRDEIAAVRAETENQRRLCQDARWEAERRAADLAKALRDQLSKGVIPLEDEHFISPEMRSIIMHAIFDERRSDLHYQQELSPNDLRIHRDQEERERLGLYLGRAIADRLADAYAGRDRSSSRRAA
jgi:hypothetical protein